MCQDAGDGVKVQEPRPAPVAERAGAQLKGGFPLLLAGWECLAGPSNCLGSWGRNCEPLGSLSCAPKQPAGPGLGMGPGNPVPALEASCDQAGDGWPLAPWPQVPSGTRGPL